MSQQSEVMGENLASFLASFDKEARMLKSITNLRALGSSCPAEVIGTLNKVNAVVENVESRMNLLEATLDAENQALDENMTVLRGLVEKQRDAIETMVDSDMPTFMGPMLAVDAAAVKYRPVEMAEFKRVPVSTRGRQTYEQINESFGCIYKLVSEKTAALSTSGGRKALGKGALLEFDKLKHVDHKGAVFITEPELRSTAIFASGEATGRAVLHTLRALQRVRVVRSSGENTFVLC